MAVTALGLGILGSIAVVGGFAGGLVAWIGALLNTWQLESKAWFVALLLLGAFNLGFFAMVAYLIAGPDGVTTSAPRTRALARRVSGQPAMTARPSS